MKVCSGKRPLSEGEGDSVFIFEAVRFARESCLAAVVLPLVNRFGSVSCLAPVQQDLLCSQRRVADEHICDVAVPRDFFHMICALRQETFLRLYAWCQQRIPCGVSELRYLT